VLSGCLDEAQKAHLNPDFLSKASHLYMERIFDQLEESWKLATASDLRFVVVSMTISLQQVLILYVSIVQIP